MADLTKRRNFGIAAHIDAGKTTVSERILYYTGKIHKMGEVHDGAATMDSREDEQERGITISSAATYCEWKDHTLNLIDTPGHVDFTMEVERSLKVLDGLVCVFDGVKGVEAQSETVWRQANRYKVPRIAFINKLDRTGANFDFAYNSLNTRLKANAIPIQIPVGKEASYVGSIDIIEQRYFSYEEVYDTQTQKLKDCTLSVLDVPEEYQDEVEMARSTLLDELSKHNDEIMELMLEEKTVPVSLIKKAIREGVLKLQFVPVICGTALKFKGVQPLLDAVCDYLPAPHEIGTVQAFNDDLEPIELKLSPEERFSALAFKTIHEPTGDLTFLRVYSGTLKKGDVVWNANKRKKEPHLGSMYLINVEKRQIVHEAQAGDIVGIVGLKLTVTNDTLCKKDEKSLSGQRSSLVSLVQMVIPEPVISVSIEPVKSSDRDKLLELLEKMQIEDPTFRREVNEETGQTLVYGMGELHLEVVINRIKSKYGLECHIGPPLIAFRQRLKKAVDIDEAWVKQSGGSGQFAKFKIKFEPDETVPELEFIDKITGGKIPKNFISEIRKGIKEQMKTGSRGFPFINVKATLNDGQTHPVDSSGMAFFNAGKESFREAIAVASDVVLEPRMKIEVSVPEEYRPAVIGDLNGRRFEQTKIVQNNDGSCDILGFIPLVETFKYSTVLRSLTSGRGTASLEPHDYQPIPQYRWDDIKDRY
jgi:elongation factor G